MSAGTVNYSYGPTGELYDAREWRLAYVGGTPLGTWTSGGVVYRRFIPGAGFDEWVGHNAGAGTTNRRWPLQDHQNSVIGYTDVSGAATSINTYDEYGRPGPDNSGQLQYTGQFVSNRLLGVYNHRNRFYNAQIGRFMQTDPILYGDGLNLYGYVGNDPMNRIDPWGLQACGAPPLPACPVGDVTVIGERQCPDGDVKVSTPLGTYCAEGGIFFNWVSMLREFFNPASPFSFGQAPDCPVGPYHQAGAGVGAGAGSTVAGSGSIEVGISTPGRLRGTQFFGRAAAAGTVGSGTYYSAGAQGSYAENAAPLATGVSTETSAVAVGHLGPVNASFSQPLEGGSTTFSGDVTGRGGPGGGVYAGSGLGASATVATPPLGCRSR